MDYVINKAMKISGVQSVTLAATSTLVSVQARPFRVYNTGTAVMFFGPTAALCDIGVALQPNANDGLFVSADGKFYMRGTAGQTATIVYFDQV
ncbi:MAG: hypothetical protein ACM3TR_09830 [Caulobacteraceae bacterium]